MRVKGQITRWKDVGAASRDWSGQASAEKVTAHHAANWIGTRSGRSPDETSQARGTWRDGKAEGVGVYYVVMVVVVVTCLAPKAHTTRSIKTLLQGGRRGDITIKGRGFNETSGILMHTPTSVCIRCCPTDPAPASEPHRETLRCCCA